MSTTQDNILKLAAAVRHDRKLLAQVCATAKALKLPNPRKVKQPSASSPDGHFKFPHLWPVKFPQAGRLNYQLFGLPGSGFLSW